jgi:hypothetical protein
MPRVGSHPAFAGIRRVPPSVNEPNPGYLPGSPERAALKTSLTAMAGAHADVPLFIGGREVRTGRTKPVVAPHGIMAIHTCRRSSVGKTMTSVALVAVFVAALPVTASAQVTAQVAPDIAPPWDEGIQPINQNNYWNAVACGKLGGNNPPCVFYDTGLCKNDDFILALHTPYKQVAYEVWGTVRQGKEPPTPSYSAAQRARVTIGVTPAKGSKNVIVAVVVKRGGKAVTPESRALDAPGGSFTFDFPAFAPTSDITIELVGKTRTVSCSVPKNILARFR